MSTDGKTQMRVSRTAKNDGGGTRTHSVSDGMGASLFEVDPEDVASLEPVDLWELVARLCQVTLADAGLPTMCVTHGGHLSAPDGGIDVRVQLREGDPPPPKLPLRLATIGFQVKATKMGVGEIGSEMLKDGKLRPSIEKLIEGGGGYIIATSDSAPDDEYNKRLKKMRDCVNGVLKNGQEAHVAYCDRKVLAAWVNDYPSIVPWVHLKTQGGPLHGWEPYGQWATSKRMFDGKYPNFLPDEKERFIDPRDPGRTFNLIEGIERVREVLRKGIERAVEEDGKSVRLVGLSGVGKTRFVQALFEANVGSDALDQKLAVYADAGRTLNPPPAVVLDRMISRKTRAVLIIDNCDSKLHSELVEQLGKAPSGTPVSLLTVEYDIRNETPYETQVFRLENGSIDLVQKIVIEQFPGISRVDVRTIAKFSDGNSRVAIALASAVGQTGSLAGLSDEELLDRLFRQRNEPNDALERAAKACSLVYSFDGGDQEQESEELKLLAGLARMDVQEIYEHLADLSERGLLQERGRWRAVLPQAIANRLAAQALERISNPRIEQKIDGLASETGSWRMLRSFSRRLGYLHESEKAKQIVRKWLQSGGRLGQPDEKIGWSLYTELLTNVAPVDQQGVLSVIEHLIGLDQTRPVIESGVNNSGLWLTGDDIDEGRVRLLALLRLLAYDATLFDRCLDVLLKFAVVEKDRQGSAGRIAESLFLVTLSGTLAKTDQRLRWLENRLRSDDESVRLIACRCLWKALKSRDFRSEYNFEFGARRRDFGWQPTNEEVEDWYVKFIDLTTRVAREFPPISSEVMGSLAGRFRDLWAVDVKKKSVKDSLSRAVKFFAEAGRDEGWKEGWVVIRETIFFYGKEMEEEDRKALNELEEEDRKALNELEEVARPKSLLSRLWVLVFGGHFWVDFSDSEDSSDQQLAMDDMAERMGEELAESEVLLPEAARLVTGVREGRQPSNTYVFGKSLAIHISSIIKGWEIFLEVFESRPESERDAAVLRGYLEGVLKRAPMLFNEIIDEAVGRSGLVRYVPLLQVCTAFDDIARERLLRVMESPEVVAGDFVCVGYSASFRAASDKDVAIVLKGLLDMDGGPLVAITMFSCNIRDGRKAVDPCLLGAAYEVLEAALVSWVRREVGAGVSAGVDHHFRRVIEFLLGGGSGVDRNIAEERTRCILRNLVDKARYVHLWPVLQLREGMKALFRVQPIAALDILVGDDDGIEAQRRRDGFERGEEYSPFSDVPAEVLVKWCRAGGEHRWIHLVSVVPAIDLVGGGSKWKWSPQVVALLENTPSPCDVASVLVKRIPPSVWNGSEAEAIRERLPLVDQLADILGAAYSDKVAEWRKWLQDRISIRQQWEAEYQEREAGFE